jgi:hypothetical protein
VAARERAGCQSACVRAPRMLAGAAGATVAKHRLGAWPSRMPGVSVLIASVLIASVLIASTQIASTQIASTQIASAQIASV